MLLLILLFPGLGPAQAPKIEQVRVGFPVTGGPNVFKSGSWTPVYVELSVGEKPLDKATLTVRAPDSDEVVTSYTIDLPAIAAGTRYQAITYTRPGSLRPEIEVILDGSAGSVQHGNLYESAQIFERVYLCLGGGLAGLNSALQEELEEAATGKPVEQANLARGHVASVEDVALLPEEWFGYAAVDLVLLNTSNEAFIEQLSAAPHLARREALSRWVRQGGRILVSLGKNEPAARKLIEQLFPGSAVEIQPGQIDSVDTLPALENWLQVRGRGEARPAVALAKLAARPGRAAEIMVSTGDEHKLPLVMRMATGLGQVTLVAFNLDLPAIKRWQAQPSFWKKLQAELGASLQLKQARGNIAGPAQESAVDLSGSLRDRLEDFPSVTNISFGWIALFILGYILLVGPLDYLFLSKVVKRLEWTWITFPAVVLAVSVAAYFTAYWLKGSDLLVNKIDLIDVDVEGNAVYGHSWLAMYSPEIASYTVALEPAWGAGNKQPSTITWYGRPDDRLSGFGRARGQAMFQRDYRYATDATGLIDVPIQVWTSKAFRTAWLEPKQTLFEANLRATPVGQTVTGTIKNNLPVPLEQAYLIYSGDTGRGKVYDLGKLEAGATRTLDIERQGAANLLDWMPLARTDADTTLLLKRICFHEIYPEDNRERNINLRGLDQSWRIRLEGQAILFGWCARSAGPGQEENDGPQASSRLWLGAVPGGNAARPPLSGKLTQQTFVRVFMPVQPANNDP
ncbi:MAG: hypothetical protein AB7K24_06300 [Gemmataceae bacterium]